MFSLLFLIESPASSLRQTAGYDLRTQLARQGDSKLGTLRRQFAIGRLITSGDTAKPANGIRQDKDSYTLGPRVAATKNFTAQAEPDILDSTWAEDMAPQECDQSADPAAGMRGRRMPPSRHSG